MQPLWTSKYGHRTRPMTQADRRFPLTWSINGLSLCWQRCWRTQAAWAGSDSTISGSACLLLLFTPLIGGGSLGHIVWVWQLSAPRHLSEHRSASPTCRRPGRAPHTRPSGRMELLEQMEHRRKLKVTDVCQGGWHWRRPRHLKLVAFFVCFFVFRSYLVFLR